MKKFTIDLPYNPPLNWEILINFFLMHQVIGVEEITKNFYGRSFKIGNSIGFFKVTNKESKLILEVLLSDELLLPIIERKVKRMFDLDLKPELLADKFLKHSLLKYTYTNYPALRIPGSWDTFETAVNTILSQSISVAAARKLLAKLVIRYGTKITQQFILKEGIYLFPGPETLHNADLKSLGMTRMKENAIKELSKKIVDKEIDLENGDMEKVIADLLKIKGIGQWTTEYISLRCSENKNAFPGNDLILKRYIKESLNIEEFDGAKSYLALYLWQHYLTKEQK